MYVVCMKCVLVPSLYCVRIYHDTTARTIFAIEKSRIERR